MPSDDDMTDSVLPSSMRLISLLGLRFCVSRPSTRSQLTSVLAEMQHLIVNETVRYNVELTHVDLDSSCLLLHKLLHPFIIANGYRGNT